MSIMQDKNSNIKDFLMPSIILVIICFVVTFALVTTFKITAPIIKDAADRQAEEARRIVLPESTGFELIKNAENNGEIVNINVIEVYKSQNDVGYAIITEDKGYGGKIKVITGIDFDGKINNIFLLEQYETPGLGSKAGESKFIDQFIGYDTVENVESISGATISSNAVKRAVNSALLEMSEIEEEVVK